MSQPNLPMECSACGCTEFAVFLRMHFPDFKEHYFECGASYTTEFGRAPELNCPCEHAHAVAEKLRQQPTYLRVREGRIEKTVERSAVVDYDNSGRILGIEILKG